MSKPLLIFGCGSLAKLAYYFATREMNLKVLGFVVDEHQREVDTLCGLTVISWRAFLDTYRPDDVDMFVGIGYRSMRNRQESYERLKSEGYLLRNIVSKSVLMAETHFAESNNFLMPGVVIEPGVSIGVNNVVWSNTTICHESSIGEHNFLASNVTIGGESIIGSRCFFGFSSTLVQQRSVGDDVLVAAHSLLLQNADSLTRYQGQPAEAVVKIDPLVGVCVP